MMRCIFCRPRCLLAVVVCFAALLSIARIETQRDATAATPAAKAAIDFNRQIRPILSENCFACHGPDEKQRKAKLRLDTKEGAFAKLRSGGFAIVPGKSAESELIKRVMADDPTEIMPPRKTGKHLTPQQIDVLKQW